MWPSITPTSSSLWPIIIGGTGRENHSCVVQVGGMSQQVSHHERMSSKTHNKMPERCRLRLMIIQVILMEVVK